jgi:putative phage-type endonuclease
VSVQGSPEWLAERAGHVTASRAADVLSRIKTGEADTRRKYRIQVCTERLTGNPVQGYQNAAMLWGTMTEPDGRIAYEASTGAFVEEVGFIKHPEMPWVGASPDGHIGDDGMLEIKCPESTTHLEWMLEKRLPLKHRPQVQFQMWVTGRAWVDFVSYDPRFPEHLQLFVIRERRDDAYIANLETEVKRFLSDVQEMCDALAGRNTLIDRLVASIDARSPALQP